LARAILAAMATAICATMPFEPWREMVGWLVAKVVVMARLLGFGFRLRPSDLPTIADSPLATCERRHTPNAGARWTDRAPRG
jgi:hypothetical protein